uniref:Beta-microseminoprotein n=1 Tax=Gouania willdenowi TaxID=441366 RepID=A0A8C5DKY7_GOUWI
QKSLALALLLCAVLSLSQAQCFVKRAPPVKTCCQDDTDKTWHPVGSSWRNSQCMDCTCSSCCAGYSTPQEFPDDCVSVFDKSQCKYIVHKINDPSVMCPVYAGVGK